MVTSSSISIPTSSSFSIKTSSSFSITSISTCVIRIPSIPVIQKGGGTLMLRIGSRPRHWGGPKGENRKERDGTSECYRWLAKDDLMTKTGYGYAKCLTVAGTATPFTVK